MDKKENVAEKIANLKIQLAEYKTLMKAFIDLITLTKHVVDWEVHDRFMEELIWITGWLSKKDSE